MKKKKLFILITLFIIIGVFATLVVLKYPEFIPSTKLKLCPDELISNQMPRTAGTGDKTPSQYFIMNGERREMKEFNTSWVQKNCNFKKQVVH